MRCAYCHNPDTWEMNAGTIMEASEIIEQYERNISFYKGGGITVTGGEPLMQVDFLIELFTLAKDKNIHTCIDSSGIAFNPNNSDWMEKLDKLMTLTDLVMLDIKHIDPQGHQNLTGQKLEPVLAFARYLDEHAIPVWIRHVVVPGITYKQDLLYRLGRFVGTLHNVQALDILPYHDMGKIKYQNLGIPYPLDKVSPLGKEKAAAARQIVLQGIREERNQKDSFQLFEAN